MPISQENMNVFWSDSVTIVPEWNHFIFIQLTIQDGHQEPLLKIAQTWKWQYLILCQNVSCMKPFWFFQWNCFRFMQTDYPRWPSGAVTKNSINMEMTISVRAIGWNWSSFVPECFFYKAVMIFCNLTFQDCSHYWKIAQNMKMTISQ